MFLSCGPSSTRLFLLPWRSLHLLSVSTADGVLQFKEGATFGVKVPDSLGALRSGCLCKEPSLKVLRATNPPKQRCSLSNECTLWSLAVSSCGISKKKNCSKTELAMAWSRFLYFGLILVVRAWNSNQGKMQLTKSQIRCKHCICLQDLLGTHCLWNLCSQVPFWCARQRNGSSCRVVLVWSWFGFSLGSHRDRDVWWIKQTLRWGLWPGGVRLSLSLIFFFLDRNWLKNRSFLATGKSDS